MTDNHESVTNPSDLEIKDAQVIFKTVWEELIEGYGQENLCFPKELILLGGAPGAGKGTHTEFIMKARGLTCPPIVVSQLLDTPEAKRIKDQGNIVGDREVVGIVFRKILEKEFSDGAILDGFPRTRVQVECLKLLVDKLNKLHSEYEQTHLAISFRRPTIHAMVLFISESTSVRRQLQRGREIETHNQEVNETGMGQLLELRVTDLSPDKARRRYRVFKEMTWDALQSLKEIYHYHFINAEGPVEEVEDNIMRELQYQSSLELEPRTFDRLRSIPLANEITLHARQELVRRLDTYEIEHTDMLVQVVETINRKFMPIVERHAISGQAIVNSEDRLFEDPLALSMLIDIFSERGFHAVVDKHIQAIPESVDLQTGEIRSKLNTVIRTKVTFEGSEIRRG